MKYKHIPFSIIVTIYYSIQKYLFIFGEQFEKNTKVLFVLTDEPRKFKSEENKLAPSSYPSWINGVELLLIYSRGYS